MSEAYLYLHSNRSIDDFIEKIKKVDQSKILWQMMRHNCNYNSISGVKLTRLDEQKRRELDSQLIHASKTSHIYAEGRSIPASELTNIILAESRQPFNVYVANILRGIIYEVQVKIENDVEGIILYKSTKGTYDNTSLLWVHNIHKKIKKNKK